MTHTSAMHERMEAKTGLRVTWRKEMCHAPAGAWLASLPSALVYDERFRHCFMMDGTAKNAFVAAGNVSLINLEMNDTPVRYILLTRCRGLLQYLFPFASLTRISS